MVDQISIWDIGKMNKITWTNEGIHLKDLKEYDLNPRSMTKKDFDKLVKSILQDGYHQRILVDTNNVIIGGHQRTKALYAAGYTDTSIIEVLKPSRHLTDSEFKRLNIRDNLTFGDFDFELLANHFEMEELLDWGMEINTFPNIEEKIVPDETEKKDELLTKCPHCQMEF